MTARVITQIAVAAAGEIGVDTVYALADDGSLWELVNAHEYGWRPLPLLPDIGTAPTGHTPVHP
jgi:hypothetical protein